MLYIMNNPLREFSKVSRTAFPHIYFRSFYGIPYADEMSELMNAKEKTEELHGKDTAHEETIPIMEARYKGGERALEDLIRQNPNAQVLELAAGFSLHGTTLAEKYPEIEYFESDYSPETIAAKRDVIESQLLKRKLPNLHFVQGNALDEENIKGVLADADPRRPLLVYNEGLMSYLSDAEKEKLATIIKDLQRQFGGAWITPDPAMSAERRDRLATFTKSMSNKGFLKRAEEIAGQRYDDHGFKSEKGADEFFASQAFNIEKLPQPTDLHSFQSYGFEEEMIRQLSEDIREHGKVWILKASP
jgi:O-methyltransferase involved in polyketide biosynthesis